MTYAFARLSSLGDVVLATAFARALRAGAPDARVIGLTRPAWAPLWADAGLAETWTVGPGDLPDGVRGFPTPAAAAEALRSLAVDTFFDLHGKPVVRLLAARSGAKRVVRYDRRSLRRRLAVWMGLRDANAPRTAQRYLDCLRAIGTTAALADPDDPALMRFSTRLLPRRFEITHAEELLGHSGPWVAIAPGARHATKRWPAPHFAAVVAALGRSKVRTALVGSPEERGVCEAIAAGSPLATVLAGTANLRVTAAALSRCRALVTGDSGLLHVAEAVGTPVVALFGPTVRDFGFFPYRERSIVLEESLACRPCHVHGSDRCPLGHHGCLEGISPARVLAAVLSLA